MADHQQHRHPRHRIDWVRMIVRTPSKTNFTVIPNSVLNHPNLSFKAKGLLAHILSKPAHWRTHTRQLAAVGPDGIDAIRTALRELETHGFVRRHRYQDKTTGRWCYDTHVFDSPQLSTACPQPRTDFPDEENPDELVKTE